MAEGETVDVPVVGNVKRTWLYVGVAVAVGVVGWAWWTRRGSSDEPVYVPGLNEDSGGSTTAGLGPSSPPDPGDPDLQPPRTNLEWGVRASKILIDKFGYEPVFVGVALGKYLARQTLTNDEANAIRAAIGQLGRPPEGDFPINTGPSSPPTTDPPPTTPKPVTQAPTLGIRKSGADHIALFWTAVPNADRYTIYGKDVTTGRADEYTAASPYREWATTGFITGHKYRYQIAGVSKDGQPGPKSNTVSITWE